ncbi:hypothetical protein CRYUN_Cryun41cG0030000 [Craigia yunnanensis]
MSETEPQKLHPLPTKTVITASVEGPYGHQSPYHLMYENLVLVAGGIGISPFRAVLSDILHRVRDGKPCQPKRILEEGKVHVALNSSCPVSGCSMFVLWPYQVSIWWYQGLLFIACMVASVIIFGSLVIGLWNLWDKKVSTRDEHEENDRIKVESAQSNETVAYKDSTRKNLESSTIIQYWFQTKLQRNIWIHK